MSLVRTINTGLLAGEGIPYVGWVVVFLGAGDWTSPPTIVATQFRARWRGLRPRADGRALLLRGSSVHAVGMRESLWIVGIGPMGVVDRVGLLQPNRMVTLKGASWLLEMSAAVAPPPIGSELRLLRTHR